MFAMESQNAPPIQYLKAFVIAAKHMSFKQASLELHLTPSAISQQIKSLEFHVGMSLFNRDKKQLTLTRAGFSFLNLSKALIEQYEQGYKSFLKSQNEMPFRLSLTSYIANNLIIPNLANFHQDHPSIKLQIITSEKYDDLISNDLDAAIRFTSSPHNKDKLLSTADLILVCSNAYYESMVNKERIDWYQQTLLHCRQNNDDWYQFIKSKNNISKDSFNRLSHYHFDSYDAAIQGAKAGLGIAFAVLPLSKEEVNRGKLHCLELVEFNIPSSFYLVTRKGSCKEGDYELVFNWLNNLMERNNESF